MNKLLFAVLALASIGAANAQVKLAVINTQKALLDTGEIKKAQADLEARFKPRQDQMIKLQKEMEDIQAQLNSGGSTKRGRRNCKPKASGSSATYSACSRICRKMCKTSAPKSCSGRAAGCKKW